MPDYHSITKYNDKHEAIMTSLYDFNLIKGINIVDQITKQDHFLFAVDGWINTDELIKRWKENKKRT